jgi:hypothetical protein
MRVNAGRCTFLSVPLAALASRSATASKNTLHLLRAEAGKFSAIGPTWPLLPLRGVCGIDAKAPSHLPKAKGAPRTSHG